MTTVFDIDNLLYNYKAYSVTRLYVTGNVVIKDNKYYRCIEDVTIPEEWDENKWEELNEKELALENMLIQNSISQLRNIPEYVAMCKAHCEGLLTIEQSIDYLLKNALNVYKAKGIWLDYIGWLVGIKRTYSDNSKFFCLNETHNVTFYAWSYSSETVYTLTSTPQSDETVYSDTDGTVLGVISTVTEDTITVDGTTYSKDTENNINTRTGDLNILKYFWFESGNVNETSSLDDEIYRKRILGKILLNKSQGTRNENIKIIKYMTNAEHCIITKVETMLCDITLYGDDIYQTINFQEDIENLLSEGRGIRNLTIRSSNEYE